jgi:PAS domain S-box-containing protein
MQTSSDGWFLDAESRDHWPTDVAADTVLDAVSDLFYIVDRRGRFVEWNDRFREVTGYTDAEIADLHPFDIIPDEAESEARRLLAAVADGGEVTLEAPLVTADGDRVPHEFTASPLTDDDGRVWGMTGTARAVSSRRDREGLLRDLHRVSRVLLGAESEQAVADAAVEIAQDHFECATAGVRLLDDGRLEMVAVETDDGRLDERLPPYEVGEGFVGAAYERGDPIRYEDLHDLDPEIDYGPARSAMLLPIPGHGMINLAATEPGAFDEADLELGRVFAADLEAAFERVERERQLRERKRELERYETLVETMGDGVYTTDTDGVITMANDTLAEMLGYDRDDLVGETPELVVDPDAFERANDLVKQLLSGEMSVATHEAELATADGRSIPIENRLSLLPGEGTVGVVRDVTERRRREQQLKRSHEELTRLNRINELIQETIHALASAATREEIETTVCERLADSEFYRLAMTGDLRRTDGVIEPSSWAGDGTDYLDSLTVTSADDATGQGPGGRAVRTGDVQVCQNVASDSAFEPWREAALAHDLWSVTVVPLRHGETVHGILAVYADETNAFSGRELRAFDVLGDMIGFAISAIQNRRLIQADQVQEFEFRLAESDTVAAGVTEHLDCRYRVLGLASTAEPGLLHYVAVEGATAAEIEATLDEPESDRIGDVRLISDDGDTCLVEARIIGSVPEILQESGVQTTEAVAEDGAIEFVARGPRDLDFRTVLGTLESTHGAVELLAKREADADVRAGRGTPVAVADRLTDRQSAALNAAYFSGYFDWPRDSTAEEVADALGISSATLHQHLRHAQRKLLEASFIDGGRSPNLDT